VILMRVIPYISVPNAKKTMKIYEDVFEATNVQLMPYSKEMGDPMKLPADFDYENSTMHGEFKIGDAFVYIADLMSPTVPVEGRVEILLEMESKAQGEAIWKKVKARNFKIGMELAPTFFSQLYGRFTDQDGIVWQIILPSPSSISPKIESKSPSKKKTSKKGQK
jgi:uncharacterized glyoxalase superfamily protein PhnB